MLTHLFTYGTLSIPEVMRAVTGRKYDSRDATLEDHQALLVAHCNYPGMVLAKGKVTEGRVYLAVDAAALACLDRFEGNLYTRKKVTVSTNGGKRLTAQAYVVPPGRQHRLSPGEWNRERFVREDLSAFLDMVRSLNRAP